MAHEPRRAGALGIAIAATCLAVSAAAAPIVLTDPFPTHAGVSNFDLTADSLRVLYLADVTDPGLVRELFSVLVDGSAPPILLTAPMLPGSGSISIFDYATSPDSSRAVYLFDQVVFKKEIYSVPLDGSGPPVKLNGPLVGQVGPNSFFIEPFTFSPDSQWVLYRADALAPSDFDVFRVPLDGSAPPVALNAPSHRRAKSPRVSPDSTWAIYLANPHAVFNNDHLFSVPLDGSGPPTQLSDSPLITSDVQRFVVSPDSSHVVYRVYEHADLRFELYTVPIDGSAAPVKLNPPLAPGENVVESSLAVPAEFTPDSAWVLFRTGGLETTLYRSPLDGSSPAVVVVPTLISYRLSPDGARAVYTQRASELEPAEIYSVPIDGSGPPVKLSGPMTPGGEVNASEFLVTADSARVVYVADQDTDDVEELFSAPLDGSAPSLKLNGPLAAGGKVDSFRLGSDPLRAVYRVDDAIGGVDELWVAPVDRGGASARVHVPLVSGQGLVGWDQTEDGTRVVYTIDEGIQPFANRMFSAVLARCGDGIVDAGEQCDDANSKAGDCCSPSCQFEIGDGSPPCCSAGVCQVGQACGVSCLWPGACIVGTALDPDRCWCGPQVP